MSNLRLSNVVKKSSLIGHLHATSCHIHTAQYFKSTEQFPYEDSVDTHSEGKLGLWQRKSKTGRFEHHFQVCSDGKKYEAGIWHYLGNWSISDIIKFPKF